MSNSLCKSSVVKVYHEIMEDVIDGVRELFLEDGVDEQILTELKQNWKAKLVSTKAAQTESDNQITGVIKNSAANYQVFHHMLTPQAKQPNGETVSTADGQHVQKQKIVLKRDTAVSKLQSATPPVVGKDQIAFDSQQVPIQITFPEQLGLNETRVLTIEVPAIALRGNNLQKVLTGPVLTATMRLPQAIASTTLQQHINAAFNRLHSPPSSGAGPSTATAAQQHLLPPSKEVQGDNSSEVNEDYTAVTTVEERCFGRRINESQTPTSAPTSAPTPLSALSLNSFNVRQCDGSLIDTSDEDSETTGEGEPCDGVEVVQDEADREAENFGPEEEPPNSEDDVTDEDPSDFFDTDNVVVCQYDKIIRSRNKWKFHLRNGILNLNGEDYVFQMASGDAVW